MRLVENQYSAPPATTSLAMTDQLFNAENTNRDGENVSVIHSAATANLADARPHCVWSHRSNHNSRIALSNTANDPI